MSATEKDYQTCLPPEAYIRICKSANNVVEPKFRSSYYPKQARLIETGKEKKK